MNNQSKSLYQSSSTWRHSATRWSFPKARRFSLIQLQQPPYYSIKDSRNKTTACSLGKGQKQYIPIWDKKKAKEMPPPNKYNIKWMKSSLFGKFGKDNRFREHQKQDLGPGTYDISKLSNQKITLKGRIHTAQKQRSPGPKYLFKDPHQTLSRNISLKPRLRAKTQFDSPSPFQYRVPQWPSPASFKCSK